jgi:hypothetical protein
MIPNELIASLNENTAVSGVEKNTDVLPENGKVLIPKKPGQKRLPLQLNVPPENPISVGEFMVALSKPSKVRLLVAASNPALSLLNKTGLAIAELKQANKQINKYFFIFFSYLFCK